MIFFGNFSEKVVSVKWILLCCVCGAMCMALPLLVLLAAQAIIFRKVGNERKGPRLLDEARETELKVGWVKVRVASPLFLTSNLQCSGDGSIERTATNLKATHTFKSATVVSAPK